MKLTEEVRDKVVEAILANNMDGHGCIVLDCSKSYIPWDGIKSVNNVSKVDSTIKELSDDDDQLCDAIALVRPVTEGFNWKTIINSHPRIIGLPMESKFKNLFIIDLTGRDFRVWIQKLPIIKDFKISSGGGKIIGTNLFMLEFTSN